MVCIAVSPSGDDQDNTRIHHHYVQAVLRTGALPLILPLTEDRELLSAALDKADGLLLTGGSDVHPSQYHEEPLPSCNDFCPHRDRTEKALLLMALERNMPVFGICRGFQLMNCVLGGSLYQDIAEQYKKEIFHAEYDRIAEYIHTVSVEKDSLLHKITNADLLSVNSRHHQGIKHLSPSLRATAVAPDGLIEAAEMPDKKFVLGVQWHPESLSIEHEDARQLFNAFVRACEEYRNQEKETACKLQ